MTHDRPAVAVIGASGFLGSTFVRIAEAAGASCASFTRAVPFIDGSGQAASGLRRAHTVYWLAGTITPAVAEREPDQVSADRSALRALVDAVSALDHQPRIVLVSSGGTVYDPGVAPPYHEQSPTRPTTAYAAAKLAQEELVLGASSRNVVVRVANAYGPGQQARRGQGVIAHWLQAAAEGRGLTVIGDPATTRDYVHADDVANALLAIGTAERPPAVLNVGSGEPTSLDDLAKLVQAVTGDVAPIMYSEGRAVDVSHTWLDVSRAADTLGWHPVVSLTEGLEATWRAVRDR